MRYPAFIARQLERRAVLETLYMLLLVYVMLDAIILAWFFLTPVLATSDNRLLFGVSMLAYNFGYLTSNCHQMPQRTLFIGGYPMPFCARDTGIYLGCMMGGLAPLLKVRLPKPMKSPLFLLASLTPLAVDGVTQTILSLRESNNEIRMLTGILFGFGLVYFFSSRIVEVTSGRVDSRSEARKTAVVGAFILALLLAASFMAGDDYKTLDQAVSESGLNPSYATYFSKRMVWTLRYDPYLTSYDDVVLDEILDAGRRSTGLWVLYEGEYGNNGGKHVYFNKANGNVTLVADQ
ncbi:MAG: DUF2085 domain-containing protein [Candidatus Altiarchaeales archaeon]|nr:DUF2085 domain-containing protein [Candidatus Altiarchaeales archaeon]MBD3416545.1 DUF2085 domain-containing protein [Candidatus Altiarchaeales archaeon]